MSCEGCQEKNIIIVLEVSDGSKSIQIFDDNGSPEYYDYSDSKLNVSGLFTTITKLQRIYTAALIAYMARGAD